MGTDGGRVPLGAHHPDVKHLRALLRDRRLRTTERTVVVEGPRALSGALDRGAAITAVFADPDAGGTVEALLGQAADAGVSVRMLAPGVSQRVGTVQASQGVHATVAVAPADTAPRGDLVLVIAGVGDPGNLGTIIRSAEAAGVASVFVGAGSVDVYNPKTIRASAGAAFGVHIVEVDAVTTLTDLATAGYRRYGAQVHGGTPADGADLTGRVALVLGHETRGLTHAEGLLPIDEAISIPMHGEAESLNLAMAATVLCFEAARQRRGSMSR